MAIAVVLSVWGLYGFSGAGVLVGRLPFLRVGLVGIALIYLLRGTAGLVLPFFLEHPAIAANSLTFWLVSSSICVIFGGFYMLGVIASWHDLGAGSGLRERPVEVRGR